MTTEDRWTDRKFDQSVRDTAYFLWEQDGRPEGMEQDTGFVRLSAAFDSARQTSYCGDIRAFLTIEAPRSNGIL